MAFLALPWFVVQGLPTTVSGLPVKGWIIQGITDMAENLIVRLEVIE